MSGVTIDRLSGNGPYTPGAKAVSAQNFLLLMEGQRVTLPDGTTVGPEDGPFFIGLTWTATIERADVIAADGGDDRMASGDVKGLFTRFVEILEKVRVPVVHVDVTPDIHFHAPEQPAPIVNLTLPETNVTIQPTLVVPPAEVTVNVPPHPKHMTERQTVKRSPDKTITEITGEREYWDDEEDTGG